MLAAGWVVVVEGRQKHKGRKRGRGYLRERKRGLVAGEREDGREKFRLGYKKRENMITPKHSKFSQ